MEKQLCAAKSTQEMKSTKISMVDSMVHITSKKSWFQHNIKVPTLSIIYVQSIF